MLPHSRLAPMTATDVGASRSGDAARLGSVLAGFHHGPGLLRGVDVEVQGDHAVVEVPWTS